MPKPADLAQRSEFRLGPLLVSPGRRLVSGPAGERHLEPLVMEVLLLLVDARGTLVTRDDLFDHCWGGVQIGDNSLNRVVAGVRRALAETAPGRFELETIPRTGYRLIPNVRSDQTGQSMLSRRGTAAVAAGSAIVLGALAFFLLSPRQELDHKPVLAVLPFRAIDAQNASLVDGIWEDTRQAIGRNPQIVVIGPNSALKLAEKGEGAARAAADYLLEASVHTSGDRIRVNTQLVRTKDGEQIWSQDFDRKLSDIFALQSEIASEIEGRIRGRLAKKGGVMPQHIATSSNVYLLYSDARAKVRTGDERLYPVALEELKQVIRTDPNFAPGWAETTEINAILAPSLRDHQITDHAEEYARKAIDLAPNLAEGHAALAQALNLQGPIARSEIERAVQLDPNDFEAVTWLGDYYKGAGDKRAALEAYTRAVAIEPLFSPAFIKKCRMLDALGDRAGIARFLEEEKRLGGDYLVTSYEVDTAFSNGHPAQAVNFALHYWTTGRKEGRTSVGNAAFDPMMQLGFIDEAIKLQNGLAPDFAPYLLRDEPKGLDMFEAHQINAKTLFQSYDLLELVAAAYVLNGRSAKLAEDYLSLGWPPQQFARLDTKNHEHFLYWAPIVAVALKKSGHLAEASDLSSFTRAQASDAARDRSALHMALLARIDAVEGRKEEALGLLASAVHLGWIPPAPLIPVDLYKDPALSSLAGDVRFEGLRDQILGMVKQERARVDPVLLRRFDS